MAATVEQNRKRLTV